ncbi:MAG: hypothetical protein KJ970_19905 [Candidatus Eisenbacteria bacterium]|uniref:Uncharacterized protein n=1 Tax=Eiseniibacteriota bacterium TaxID=2212470 RepID=A0A948W5D4_UNCEI|nr:hypothetical protein [Candidatus Eisenbacteria bacterium]MBU1950327.1 hypothetical protein [Candidatus Eisenbacteria bacterium]MBU2693187.1 hypothetical protein [Candidatus Eisenbacteria bacterium]
MIKSEKGIVVTGVILAFFLAIAWTVANPADASDKTDIKKLKRQTNVMTKVIDEALVDSPNLLVYSSNPTHDLYLEEFGVVFTFEASLVDKGSNWKDLSFLKNFKVQTDDGKIIISKDSEDEDAEELDEEEAEEVEKWRDKDSQRDERLYTRGKEELIDVLIYYGDTMDRLPDDSWVAIAAFLKNSDYFVTNRISQLILKAKVRDLKAYGEDKLTDEEMIAKVVVEEY